MHMHAKYQVAIFNIAKVRAMLKFSDGRTDRLTDNSKTICHPTGGIKNCILNLFIGVIGVSTVLE